MQTASIHHRRQVTDPLIRGVVEGGEGERLMEPEMEWARRRRQPGVHFPTAAVDSFTPA